MSDAPTPAGWVTVRIMATVEPPRGRVIWHHNRRHADRARELRVLMKNFAGEKRAAIAREAESHEERAKTGRNLYRCEVCGAWGMWGPGWASWGTVDEAEAFVCSASCQARHKQRKRRGGR